MIDTILLTGATGFLGTAVARLLIDGTRSKILALVRAESQEAAERKLSRAWWDWPELVEAIGGRVEVVRGEVSEHHLGIEDGLYERVVRRVTHIIHTAADMRLDAPIDELRRTNVQGTANVLELARAAHRDHSLSRLSHVSTAYVAGGRKGYVPEEALTDEFGFSSAYEMSKYEGELLVQAAKSEFPISVFRPGLVVGDSRTGAIKTFNTLYFPLRLCLTGRLRVLPSSPSLRVNLVPVDYVAEAVVKLTFHPKAAGLNFHLTAPPESLPTARQLLEAVRHWAKEQMGLKLPPVLFIPMPVPAARYRYRTQAALQRKERGIFDALVTLAPYFNEKREFGRDNVDRLLGPYDLEWRQFLGPILDYAVQKSFLHRSERTVHEQVLFRLSGRSRPVTYHDIVGGRIVTRSAGEVRWEILAAAGALRSMGVGAGDRVALVGLNSTRYLALDVAIGLIGAVSVPLYYTSPPSDVDAVVEASGSRLLLVGAPQLLDRLGELRSEVQVVSFCRGPVPAGEFSNVMAWEDFLARGDGCDSPVRAPVGFGDIATLRYSSGTTGQPKGVAFRHDNLRWMGECVASLLPWKVRNEAASYLSFLPMNHVVEGILGTYAPYYIPAPVDVYFLEDFRDLRSAMPQVRPTIFFSIPRFYEKAWDGLAQSPIGRRYMALPDGLRKRALGLLVRRSLLKKTGLDRCAQLIAGSAPAGEDLLQNFHGLGVEIHNAYGLTEAPLVTMNRLGANHIGTVGEPLPETEIRLADDGEVLVRGPQVAAGYFAAGAVQPFEEGWLATGDLGCLTPEDSLVLLGRKKDLIITSYGKNVFPMKVEAMLREIPGVAEAMMVGDGRPYCSALIWVAEDRGAGAPAGAVDRAVMEVNRRLSHPEQLKSWAVLRHDLSIEGGDLTASLKLKRQAIQRRFLAVMAALYGEGERPASVLHLGSALRGASV